MLGVPSTLIAATPATLIAATPATLIAAALGDELTESEASLRIFLTAGGLAILGLMLLLFTIWWWRGTRPEPPALGPLEVMGDRRWSTATDAERRRMIDLHRPADSFALEGVVAPIPIDLSVLARDLPRDFDDLREPALALGPSPDGVPSAAEPEPGSVGWLSSDGASVDDSVDGDAPLIAEIELNRVHVQPIAAEPHRTVDADATMYQVEAPSSEQVEAVEPAGEVGDDADVETELDHVDVADDDQHHYEPSDELVIDPLLQRTASQD